MVVMSYIGVWLLYIHYLPTYCIPMYVTYAYISVLLHRCIHPIFLHMLKSVYFTLLWPYPRNTPKTTLPTSWPGPKPAYAKIPQNAAGIHTFRPNPVQDPPRPTPARPPFWSIFGVFRCSPDTLYFDHFLDVCCFMLISVIPDGAILVPVLHTSIFTLFYTLVLDTLFYTLFYTLFLYPCFGTLVLHPILIPCFGWCVFDTLFWYLF